MVPMQAKPAQTGTGKNMPNRMCIACGKKTSVSALLRVALSESGDLLPDPRRRLPGRGAHVCLSELCLTIAIEKRLFNRAFRMEIVGKSLSALRALTDDSVRKADGERRARNGMNWTEQPRG